MKAATAGPHPRGVSVPFPLWKQPDALPAALAALVAKFPEAGELAVTMTGELCDCFETKADGVRHIVAAAVSAAGGKRVRFWTTGGRFVGEAEARSDWNAVAAANWHALATFAGRFAPTGPALLIDVGSTTTDVIPLRDGVPCALGRTDPERLRQRELVYTGVRRTPLCALLPPGETCAELFATTLDAHLLLGNIPDDPADTDTADGRPATRVFAHTRIARMIGGDGTTVSEAGTLQLATAAADTQLRLLREAVTCQPRGAAITSGSGEFLAQRTAVGEVFSLGAHLGPALSGCAPAYAAAVLLAERH